MNDENDQEIQQQAKPCRNCPFDRPLSVLDVAEACEGKPGEIEMLCHESGCLDGVGPDKACRGFQNNLEGLGYRS